MNKSDSTNTLEVVYLSNSSLLSDSTNISDDVLNDKNIQTQESVTRKPKNRFVSAFRSFRKKNSETKSTDDRMRKTETEELKETQQKSLKSEKKRNRATSLVRRLSMSSIRRTKKSTTDNIKRETPEGATLSVSEISLIEIGVENTLSTVIADKPTVDESISKIQRKGGQLQITISGKKIEKLKDSTVTPILTSNIKVIESEPSKPQRKSKKSNITVSDQDISPNVPPPPPPVPYSICGSDISSISNIEKISHTHTYEQSSISKTGVIKKSSFRKQRNTPFSMSKSGSLERGRRYPRPTDEFIADSSSGNNITNSNLSGPVSDPPIGTDSPSNPSQSQPSQSDINIEKPKIEFEVGTKVRPLSTSNLNRIDETTVIISTKDELSSLDTSKCSESSSESKSDTSRRRIAYVATAAISLSEDEAGVADSLLSREPLSHLSGISEYNSLDSDFSLPPLFGDVIDDEDNGTNMASAPPEKRENLYKILVIGELGTGKTSFIKRYVHQFFSQNYRATIGVDFALKVLNWDSNTIIRLQLWDIAGQERFGNMTRVYYKEAVGAFIVFDVTRSATFDAVVKWKQDLDSKVHLPNGSPIPCILLANKCDQTKQGIAGTPAKMDEYVKEHGFAGWFETSAEENVHIEEAARTLVNKILLNDKLISTNDIGDPDKFGLDSASKMPKKNCSC